MLLVNIAAGVIIDMSTNLFSIWLHTCFTYRQGNSPAVMDSISLPCLNILQSILQTYKVIFSWIFNNTQSKPSCVDVQLTWYPPVREYLFMEAISANILVFNTHVANPIFSSPGAEICLFGRPLFCLPIRGFHPQRKMEVRGWYPPISFALYIQIVISAGYPEYKFLLPVLLDAFSSG